jgi:predicted transcriptional regulator
VGKSLSKATADLIVTLHQAGRTHRAIATTVGVSRVTVYRVLSGRWSYRAPAKRHAKPAERCPSCGVLCAPPCVACIARAASLKVGQDDSDESDSLAIDLVGSEKERYEALRVVKELNHSEFTQPKKCQKETTGESDECFKPR